MKHILLLIRPFLHLPGPDEWRITHNIVQSALVNHTLPIQPQSVPFHNIRLCFQWKEVQFHVDDVFRFLQHLALCNPKSRAGDGHGEVIDLDSVELGYRYLYRVEHIIGTQGNLSGGYFQTPSNCAGCARVKQAADNLVLQPPNAEIGFS